MTMSVEIRDHSDVSFSEIAICLDGDGLEFLLSELMRLRGGVDHVHFMSPSWGEMSFQKTQEVEALTK